jgi:hypothetical protein
MKSASLLLVPLTVILLSACGGSGSGGDGAPAPQGPIDPPTKAVLTLAPASIELFAQSETPVTLTVTNTSASITATSISALLPAGWTDVTQDASACVSLPPQAHCTLSFTPGDVSHPQASVNIGGTNTETASASIVVSPFNGVVIAPLTATEVVLEVGQTVTMAFVNNSATMTATNISARLAGTVLAANVTQDATACGAVLPGASCNLTISAGNTPVSATSFSIRGDNTSAIGGSIAITLPTSAQIGITGSPLVLQATAGTPAAGSVTITNLSTDITATNIAADFSNTALQGEVTQDASNCTTLAPAQSCTLSFTPGATAVTQTSFTIHGDNTSQVGASIAIDAPQATLSVTGSPLVLFANGTPASVVVTNISDDTATNIASNFTGTALDGNVTETSVPCATLASHQSCTLTFTPGSTLVPSTAFTIAGSNTNTVVADITIRALALGDTFGGGVVLQMPAGGNPGLIASDSSSSELGWGQGVSTSAWSDDNGANNTQLIITRLGNNFGTPYAAGYCNAMAVGPGGVYSDWYLPAKNQLTTIMTAAQGITPAPSMFQSLRAYWSSTEDNSINNDAWYRSFSGMNGSVTRSAPMHVVCVREFTL